MCLVLLEENRATTLWRGKKRPRPKFEWVRSVVHHQISPSASEPVRMNIIPVVGYLQGMVRAAPGKTHRATRPLSSQHVSRVSLAAQHRVDMYEVTTAASGSTKVAHGISFLRGDRAPEHLTNLVSRGQAPARTSTISTFTGSKTLEDDYRRGHGMYLVSSMIGSSSRWWLGTNPGQTARRLRPDLDLLSEAGDHGAAMRRAMGTAAWGACWCRRRR